MVPIKTAKIIHRNKLTVKEGHLEHSKRELRI